MLQGRIEVEELEGLFENQTTSKKGGVSSEKKMR